MMRNGTRDEWANFNRRIHARCSFLPKTRSPSVVRVFLLGAGGALLLLLFALDLYLPRNASIVILFAVAGWGIATARANQLALLERLMIVLYVLPFSVTIGYLFDPEYCWATTPIRMELLSAPVVVAEMLHAGLVGLLGLLTGMKVAEMHRRRLPRMDAQEHAGQSCVHGEARTWDENERSQLGYLRAREVPTLDITAFFGLLFVSMVLSYADSGTSHTLFAGGYRGTGSTSLTTQVGFGAGLLGSHLICILLFLDIERDTSSRRRVRMQILIAAAVFAIVFFELIRGTRTAIGLVAALMALYLTGSGAQNVREMMKSNAAWKKRFRKLLLPALVVLVVYVGLGRARTQLADHPVPTVSQLAGFVVEGLSQNTWTMILWTNIGLAGFHQAGDIDYLYGRTYMDYLLSLPPGPVAHMVGYTRPLEHFQGPAWWFVGIGGGGVHPVAVPFMNFGIVGVFAILALFGVFIVWADNPNGTMLRRVLYGGMIAGSFKWFWYGDMTMIRVLMGVGILWILYGFLIRVRSRAV